MKGFRNDVVAPVSRLCLALFAAAALSACGGGGSGNPPADGTPTTPGTRSFDAAQAQSLTGSIAPQETVADQTSRAAEILPRQDRIDVSRLYGEFVAGSNSGNLIMDFEGCSGSICNYTFVADGGIRRRISIDLNTIVPTPVDATRAILTRNGITFIESSSRALGSNARAYGAWLDNGYFGVITGITASEGNIQISGRGASVLGDVNRSRPTADATYRGVMVGTPARGSNRDNILQGDAELTYTFVDSEIDAHFSNIVNLDRGTAHSVTDIRFNNVPVAIDGSYAQGISDNRISGGFGGPNHEGDWRSVPTTRGRRGFWCQT